MSVLSLLKFMQHRQSDSHAGAHSGIVSPGQDASAFPRIPIWPRLNSVWPGIASLAFVGITHAEAPKYEALEITNLVGTVDATFTRIGCDKADQKLTLKGNTLLDPQCVYSGGFTIPKSGVTLDCRGAKLIAGPNPGRGIVITSPGGGPLSDVTVRNCFVKGFASNNLRVTRPGFKSLEKGKEYDVKYTNILIENSRFYDSYASGIYIDAFVSGVTLRNIEVAGSGMTGKPPGGVGIYLEAGSVGTTIENSHIHHNGYAPNLDQPTPEDFGNFNIHYKAAGREGIAIDGSRYNKILNNRIVANALAGITLYKNCSEFKTKHPDDWWPRRYGADDNLIEGNVIAGSPNGVWAASRMSENQYPLDCGDPVIREDTNKKSDLLMPVKIYEDFAKGNVIRKNKFRNVRYGVRIEDDGNTVEGNTFLGKSSEYRAVVLGTLYRPRPVTKNVIVGNEATIDGVASPYVSFGRQQENVFKDNRSGVSTVDLKPSAPPEFDPMLFLKSIGVMVFGYYMELWD